MATTFACFESRAELSDAIFEYRFGNESAFETYGPVIGDWCVDRVQDFSDLFAISDFNDFNEPLTNWNTSSATTMRSMFELSDFNQPVNHFDTSKVKDFKSMFDSATEFNQPLDAWDTSNGENFEFMFFNTPFNSPVTSWNTSSAMFMSSMFSLTRFNQPLSKWNTAAAVTMDFMFQDAIAFNQPLNRWDVRGVETMDDMFKGAEKFQQNLCDWSLDSLDFDDASLGMFEGTACWNQNVPEGIDGPLCNNCRVADCRAKLLKRCKCSRKSKSKSRCARIVAKKSVNYNCAAREENGRPGCICTLANEGRDCIRNVLKSKRHCGELGRFWRKKLAKEYLKENPLCG